MARGALASSACPSARRIALLPPRAMMASAPLAAPAITASTADPVFKHQRLHRRPAGGISPTTSRRSSSLLVRCDAVATTSTSTPTPPPPTPTIAAVAAPSCRLVKEVAVAVQRTSISSRVLNAAVDIAAPPSAVWHALTDYERLADFIPSLETNECLSHDPVAGYARLRQVGAQDVAMGVKFRAAVTLDIREHKGPGGISQELVTTSSDSRDYLGQNARFPMPVASPGEDEDEDGALVEAARAASAAAPASDDEGGGSGASSPSSSSSASWPRDISFELVEGDFSAFRGIWRVSEGPAGPLTSRLSYAVFVQPQAFLPVGLIQGRITKDVATNLKSVRAHAEEVVFERLLKQQMVAAEAAQAEVQAAAQAAAVV